MPLKAFPAGNSGGTGESYIEGNGSVYSDGFVIPTGRQMLNGARGVWIAWAEFFVTGRIDDRVVAFRIDGHKSPDMVSQGSSASTARRTRGVMGMYREAGKVVRLQIDGNGQFYFGRGVGVGGVTRQLGTSRTWNGGLLGVAGYYQAPTPPARLAIDPISETVIRLAWSGWDAGEGDVYGFRVQYATRPDFVGAVTRDVTGSPWDFTGLRRGTNYYFRVATLNEVTRAAGSSSLWSATISAPTHGEGVFLYDGSAWGPAEVLVHDGSTFVRGDVLVHDGSSFVLPD